MWISRKTLDEKLRVASKDGFKIAEKYMEFGGLLGTISVYAEAKEARTKEQLEFLLNESKIKAKKIYSEILNLEKRYFDRHDSLNSTYKKFIGIYRELKDYIQDSKLKAETS